MKNSMVSFRKLESRIMFLAHMLTNKMGLPSANTVGNWLVFHPAGVSIAEPLRPVKCTFDKDGPTGTLSHPIDP